MANDYRKLPRDIQLASLANLHEMAMKFAAKSADPEMAQPKPAKGGRTAVTDPPGMPTRRFGVRGAVDLRVAARTFDAYVDSLTKGLKQFEPAVTTRVEIKHFPPPFGKAAGK